MRIDRWIRNIIKKIDTKELEKFVSYNVEPQIIEGFVFETDRYIVKLTGAFQALNRITGTARYQFGEIFEEE